MTAFGVAYPRRPHLAFARVLRRQYPPQRVERQVADELYRGSQKPSVSNLFRVPGLLQGRQRTVYVRASV